MISSTVRTWGFVSSCFEDLSQRSGPSTQQSILLAVTAHAETHGGSDAEADRLCNALNLANCYFHSLVTAC